ncbi:MAG: hypothetical protein K6F77_08220 [Lachnospiraceae bacterium]|nr:hypothetical protein [Lachnospiraceae bacterium]
MPPYSVTYKISTPGDVELMMSSRHEMLKVLKTGGTTSVKQNYTREQLLTFIDDVTKHSSEIVANINAGNITLEFANEDDIQVHVWKNYKRRGGK